MNQLLAVSLAAVAACLFATMGVTLRKFIGGAGAFAGARLSSSVAGLMVGILSLFLSDWSRLTAEAALWFFLAGALAPGIGLSTMCLGIRRIGVARMMPLATLCPFFSVLVAMVWLGERPGPLAFLATACVIGGCLLTSLKPKRDSNWSRLDLWIPLVHALVVAFSASMRRHGMLILSDPFIGVTTAMAGAATALTLALPFLPAENREPLGRRGRILFAGTGLIVGSNFIAQFHAYQWGGVSIVMPVVYSAPLFTLLLASIFLRKEEVITWQKVAGAVSIFAGMILMAAYAAG